MVSLESVKYQLLEQRGNILIILQEQDTGYFDDQVWQDELFAAWELVGLAVEALDRAVT